MSDRFVILNPCAKRWSDLPGHDRRRFCPDCQTHVHDIAQYSDAEIDALRRNTPGKLCGYLARESAPPPRSRRAILVGAMLTAISPLMAQSGRVRIRVTDATTTAVPGADAAVLDGTGKPKYTAVTNGSGELVFSDLPLGDNRIVVNKDGFERYSATITIRDATEVKLDAVLKVGSMGGTVIVQCTDDHPCPTSNGPYIRVAPRDKELSLPPVPPAPSSEVKKRRRWWPFR